MLLTLMNDMKSALKAGEKSELGALRNHIFGVTGYAGIMIYHLTRKIVEKI